MRGAISCLASGQSGELWLGAKEATTSWKNLGALPNGAELGSVVNTR